MVAFLVGKASALPLRFCAAWRWIQQRAETVSLLARIGTKAGGNDAALPHTQRA